MEEKRIHICNVSNPGLQLKTADMYLHVMIEGTLDMKPLQITIILISNLSIPEKLLYL